MSDDQPPPPASAADQPPPIRRTLSAAERAEQRRQKILARSIEPAAPAPAAASAAIAAPAPTPPSNVSAEAPSSKVEAPITPPTAAPAPSPVASVAPPPEPPLSPVSVGTGLLRRTHSAPAAPESGTSNGSAAASPAKRSVSSSQPDLLTLHFAQLKWQSRLRSISRAVIVAFAWTLAAAIVAPHQTYPVFRSWATVETLIAGFVSIRFAMAIASVVIIGPYRRRATAASASAMTAPAVPPPCDRPMSSTAAETRGRLPALNSSVGAGGGDETSSNSDPTIEWILKTIDGAGLSSVFDVAAGIPETSSIATNTAASAAAAGASGMQAIRAAVKAAGKARSAARLRALTRYAAVIDWTLTIWGYCIEAFDDACVLLVTLLVTLSVAHFAGAAL